MLVLTRKVNQSIIIDDQVEIMIVEVKGDQVKIGINAPREVKIYRGEIYKEIQDSNREAAKTQVSSKLPKISKIKVKKK